MAIVDQSGLAGKIRDKPIGQKLKTILERAAVVAGVDVVKVTSGSQPGTTGRRTGSTRHDNGRAADLQLVKDGRTLTFTDQSGGTIVEAFVTACAAYGATGIGAGLEYMGNATLHVGFGLNAQDRTKLVWGAGGRSANAPRWLRTAAEKGWSAPAELYAEEEMLPAGSNRYVVIARGGLHLRKGPGLEFGITKTLDTGTEVTVLAFDGPHLEWARVDLMDDGLADGHLFSAYLRPAAVAVAYAEEVEEPESEAA